MSSPSLGGYNVAIFTFNTEAVSFCNNTKQASGIFKKCIVPDFVEQVAERFQTFAVKPDIIVVGLQESSMPGDDLVDAFASVLKRGYDARFTEGYTLVHQDKLIGLGQEGFLGFIRGLRLAVFFKDNLTVMITGKYTLSTNSIRCSTQFLGKGALSVTFNLPATYQFIVAHLPYVPNDPSGLQGLRDRIDCFNKILTKLVNADNVFLFGDLNYRVQTIPKVTTTQVVDEIFKQTVLNGRRKGGKTKNIVADNYDQLRQVHIGRGHQKIKEAPIEFMPTCKLLKNRTETCEFVSHSGEDVLERLSRGPIECYETSKGKTPRIPSWCDRILYMGDHIVPMLYDSVTTGNIKRSDHAAVIGIFQYK